jgi:nucleoside phosphorylase
LADTDAHHINTVALEQSCKLSSSAITRRPPSNRSIKILFAASGGLCAFPHCTTRLVDSQTGSLLGELCHIQAASEGGPRFNPAQSDDERNEADNYILLCPNHHRLVDQDPRTYSVHALRGMKKAHENRVAKLLSSVASELTDKQASDLSRQVDDESVDFAIIVALRKEFEALKSYFPELAQIAPNTTSSRSYFRAMVPTRRGGSYRVIVTLLHSMGNLEAAHATADLIRVWNPRFILVNGIAGGLLPEKQELGDVVISSTVVYYELAKIKEKNLERRNRQFQTDRRLLDGALNLTDSAWRGRLPQRPDGKLSSALRPAVHIGPIASGEKIIATIDAVRDLKSFQIDLIAIEMESAGVASAAFSAVKNVGFLASRAICDFADASKNDNWQEYAAHTAASFLRSFIESGPVPLSEGDWPKSSGRTASDNVGMSMAKRKRLFDQLCTAFDMEEFKNLCFLLGVDIDEVPGDRKSARIRELILLFKRRDDLEMLEEAVFEHPSAGEPFG